MTLSSGYALNRMAEGFFLAQANGTVAEREKSRIWEKNDWEVTSVTAALLTPGMDSQLTF